MPSSNERNPENEQPTTTTRRKYLKAGLVAGIGSTLFPGMVSTAAGASYETVTVPAGEKWNLLVEDETKENILYDVTADEAGVSFYIKGNSTIRNIGIKGKNQAGRFIFRIGGGTHDITIDHVYTEHYDPSKSDPPGGILASRYSAGNLYVRGASIHGFGDSNTYFSKSDMTVLMEDSYIKNGRTAGFRGGGNYHGNNRDHVFRNCRFVCEDMSNTALYDYGGDRVRGFIGKHGTIEMHNCHSWIKVSADPGSNWEVVDADIDSGEAECKLWDCELNPEDRIGRNVTLVSGNGYNPSDQPPSYAPTSAEDAASGSTTSDGGSNDSDTSVVVSTDSTTSVDTDSATLEGTLTDLGGASSSDVGFNYREAGTGSWNTTVSESLSSTGAFEETVSGLSSGTEYEYQAVAYASDGDTATGGTVMFTTGTLANDLKIDGSNIGEEVQYEITVSEDIVKGEYANDNDTISGSTATGQVHGGIDTYDFSGEVTDVWVSQDVPVYVNGSQLELNQSGSSPSIDRIEVTEAGSKNPHANITAEWDASDPDGDLSSGTVRVTDSSGTVLKEATTSISGDTHYGVTYLEIKHVRNETMNVTVSVVDSAGNSAEATESVTE